MSDPIETTKRTGSDDPVLGNGLLAEVLEARLSFAAKGDPPPSPWGPAQAGSLGIPTD
jgi:hypothetical protein